MKFWYLFLTALLLAFVGCDFNSQRGGSVQPEVIERYEDGSPRRTLLRDIQTNEPVGEIELYDNEKTFRQWSYIKGQKNGESRSYREDGTPWSLNTYVNDTLHGPYKTWHENGLLYIDGQYSKGNRVGIWRFYSPAGELVREANFDNPAEAEP